MSTSPKPRGCRYARHAPPAPVEEGRGIGPERGVLERGIDPDRAASPPRWRARRCIGSATLRSTLLPSGASRAAMSGPRAPSCRRSARARAVSMRASCVLVAEVTVERAMGDAGGGDQIVDARAVIAAAREHVATRMRATLRARGCSIPSRLGLGVRAGAGRTSRSRTRAQAVAQPSGACTFTPARPEQGAVHDVGDRDSRTRSPAYPPGATDRSNPLTSSVWFEALEEEPDHRVEVAWDGSVVVSNRARIRVTVSSPVWRATAGEHVVALQRVEDRLVAGVDLGVPRHPGAQREPSRPRRESARRAPRSTRSPGAPPVPRAGRTRLPCWRSTGRRRPGSTGRAS